MVSNPKEKLDKFGRRMTVYGSSINPVMGEGRWQDALRRMRDFIAAGSQLECEDSDEVGNKYTHCSWGMCSEAISQWPEADDHVFPDEFIERARVAPRDSPGGCPLDTSVEKPDWEHYGCFFRCLAFGEKIQKQDRDRALELYDTVISKREAEHGRKTKEDDDEPWVDKGK